MTNALAALLAKKKAEATAKESPQADQQVALVPPTEEQPASEVKVEESSIVAEVVPSSPLRKLLATPKPPPKTSNVLDVDRAAALLKPELTLEAIANSDGMIDDPNAGERFKFTLDILDAKLTEIGGGLDKFNIDSVRSIVSRIMIDLKEHPDYDGLYLGDRDVHNIMSFMYKVRDIAQESNVKKVTKVEAKVQKQSKKAAIALSLDNLSLGDLSL